MEMTVSIIGFGNIGKFISGLLFANKEHKIQLNVIDTDWQVYGAVLDMEQGIELFPNQRIAYNSETLLNQSDFIFHCAGASVPKGKSRLVTCQKSIEITQAIFKNYRPKTEAFIIVVANPVEIITFITQRVTSLPQSHVIGTGTFLDSIRMNHAIRTTNPAVKAPNAILLGEHGTTVFLSEQLSTIDELPISHFYEKDSIEELMNKVKASAEEIKKTQEATIYGVSYCAIQIFEALLNEKVMHAPVSTFVPESINAELQKTPISLSLYSQLNKSGAQAFDEYVPNEHELEALNKSVNLITPFIPKQYL